jgi:shikimate kinase
VRIVSGLEKWEPEPDTTAWTCKQKVEEILQERQKEYQKLNIFSESQREKSETPVNETQRVLQNNLKP